jgi:hypothetical protein
LREFQTANERRRGPPILFKQYGSDTQHTQAVIRNGAVFDRTKSSAVTITSPSQGNLPVNVGPLRRLSLIRSFGQDHLRSLAACTWRQRLRRPGHAKDAG